MKLNCRKTLFLFLARKHALTSFVLSPSLVLSSSFSAIVAQSRFLPISASAISLVLRQSTLLPFCLRPPFIPSLLPVFAQLTRVSICFIKLRRAPFYSSLLLHSRRDISTIHSPSSTNIHSPLIRCHSRHFSFKIEVRGETRRRASITPIRPFNPFLQI